MQFSMQPILGDVHGNIVDIARQLQRHSEPRYVLPASLVVAPALMMQDKTDEQDGNTKAITSHQ